MLISIATAEAASTALIPEKLSDAKYLLIVELEQNQCLRVIDGTAAPRADVLFAEETVKSDCEAIVCGNQIEKEAFDILADAQVSRYDGYLFNASQVRKQLYTYQLPLIRDHVGGSGCHGHEEWQRLHPEDAQ